jgi:hypothetical protein
MELLYTPFEIEPPFSASPVDTILLGGPAGRCPDGRIGGP